MRFFKPEDFTKLFEDKGQPDLNPRGIACMANYHLNREAILIGYKNNAWTEFMTKDRSVVEPPYTATAFRIAVENIEPIKHSPLENKASDSMKHLTKDEFVAEIKRQVDIAIKQVVVQLNDANQIFLK